MRSDYSSLIHATERDACGTGFVADIQGRPSRRILEHALEALGNLAHRGALAADASTGDGAGVTTQIPARLFRRVLEGAGIKPDISGFGVATLFITPGTDEGTVRESVRVILERSDCELLVWRNTPIDPGVLGSVALATMPVIRQALVRAPVRVSGPELERLLYLCRKRISRECSGVYVASFSSKTISYKGLMSARQLGSFYLDLADPDYETAIALFHQRYSTNTRSSWQLAQPFRYLAHNGEINTLQGNVNFMRARESTMQSPAFGDRINELSPVIEPLGSDSAALDNAYELLVHSGVEPMRALMALIPQAVFDDDADGERVKALTEYHAGFMEPWDGPAAISITDGRYAIAGLDRNGLRPQRYWLSDHGVIVVGSETGITELPGRIIEKGRLGPGQILAVDTQEGRLLRDAEIKAGYATKRDWVDVISSRVRVPLLARSQPAAEPDGALLTRQQMAFGYHREEFERIFEPMAAEAAQPVGSMGDDTPLAALSDQPQRLYRYFRQRFAQVTNPPIDSLRERLVMSLETLIGPRGNLLGDESGPSRVIRFPSPMITDSELGWLRERSELRPWQAEASFPVSAGADGMEEALHALCDGAAAAVRNGAGIVILSDRGLDLQHRAPLPMLLACAAVHQHLLDEGLRTSTALVLETGEPREDHDFACLIGYGAGLILPWLAYDTVRSLHDFSRRTDLPAPRERVDNYRRTIDAGLLKVMSKLGISTLASYRGAKAFEALGVSEEVIAAWFRGTPALAPGIGLERIARDQLAFHAAAAEDQVPADRGVYRFRKAGEYHSLNPAVFKSLHRAVRTSSFEAFQEYTDLVDGRPASSLRDLLDYSRGQQPVPLTEVEPVEAIVTRFTTQAMSHGSVSREAHEAVAIAMNRLGAKSNSGEGGEDPERFEPYDRDRPDLSHSEAWYPRAGAMAGSRIKQVASGRFGVSAHYLANASEIEIKMAQGSKPGEGGQIPGFKVNAEIARLRGSVPGVTLISPPPHHDIYSIEDLAQLIYDLKNVNPAADISVKLVSEVGVGTVAAGVAKARADHITIAGYDGGTGASPLTSLKHAGSPWEIGLAETQQTLVLNGLRSRVALQVDGGLRTGRDVVIGALLGADEFGFATAPLIAAGCVMMRKCHLNTCPVGVATQDPVLRKRFKGAPEHVVNYFFYVAEEVRELLAAMGYRRLDEIVGETGLLEKEAMIDHWKAKGLDFTRLFHKPDAPREETLHTRLQEHPIDDVLDRRLIELARPALDARQKVEIEVPIRNVDRSAGAMLSGEVAKRFGHKGLRDDTIAVRGKVQLRPSDAFSATLTADWTEQDNALTLGRPMAPLIATDLVLGPVVLLPAPTGEYDFRTRTSFAPNQGQELRHRGLSLVMDWNLSDSLAFKSISAQRWLDTRAFIDIDASELQIGDVFVGLDQEQFSQEFQLQYDNGSNFQAVYGLSYLQAQVPSKPFAFAHDFIRFAGAPVDFLRTINDDLTTTSYAAFVHGNWEFQPGWTLAAGLRYTSEKKDYYRTTTTVWGAPLQALGSTFAFDIDDKWSALTPSLSLQRAFSDRMMGYVSANRGFKSGGFNGRANSATEVSAFDPEYVWTYEAGLKMQSEDRRLQGNIAAFRSNYKDFQARVSEVTNPNDPVPNFTFPVLNAAELTIDGVEFEGLAIIGSGTRLSAQLGWLDARYKRFDDPRVALNPALARLHDHVPFSPEWTARFAASQSFYMDNGASFTLGGDVSYRDDVWLSVDNREVLKQDGYALVGLLGVLDYASGRWQVRAGVRNLTDKDPPFNNALYGFPFYSNTLYNIYGRVPYMRYEQRF